ncbi:hypothetical protein [Pontibacter harenae]|uniref:hypothetical protein n=1 Tax=Pontibacter harenae TaxID=2894083 RepID=UPI001E3994BA|nr:hypothetical protein [Pontibacter harenae]MCC9165602.1 hypothetical protein [Pontibacter harenae]
MHYKWTSRLTLFCPVFLIIALLLAGGGHGWLEPAIILFPLGLLSIVVTDSLNVVSLLLAVIQYPLYGLLLDKAQAINQLKRFTISILLFHLLLVVIILVMRDATWR